MKLFSLEIRIVFVIGLATLFFSCDEDGAFKKEVKVDLNRDFPKTAIYYNLEPYKEEQAVYVYSTKSISDKSDPEAIAGASVKLIKDNKQVVFTEGVDNGSVIYEADGPIDLQPNDTLLLEVITPDNKTLRATEVIPAIPKIEILEDKITWEVRTYGTYKDSSATLTVKFRITDVKDQENFYSFGMNQYYTSGSDTIRRYYNIRYDPDDPSLEETSFGQFLPDRLFQNSSIVKTVQFPYLFRNNVSKEFIAFSHSKEKYRLGVDLVKYRDNDENPFAEPIVIYSNVEGGTGHFVASSTIEPISF